MEDVGYEVGEGWGGDVVVELGGGGREVMGYSGEEVEGWEKEEEEGGEGEEGKMGKEMGVLMREDDIVRMGDFDLRDILVGKVYDFVV